MGAIDRDNRVSGIAVVRFLACGVCAVEVCKTNGCLACRAADCIVIAVISEQVAVLRDVKEVVAAKSIDFVVTGNRAICIDDAGNGKVIPSRAFAFKQVGCVDRNLLAIHRIVVEDVLFHRHDNRAGSREAAVSSGTVAAVRALVGEGPRDFLIAGLLIARVGQSAARICLRDALCERDGVTGVLFRAALDGTGCDDVEGMNAILICAAVDERIRILVTCVGFLIPLIANGAEVLVTADAAIGCSRRGNTRAVLCRRPGVLHVGSDGNGDAFILFVPVLAVLPGCVVDTAVGVLADEHCLAEGTAKNIMCRAVAGCGQEGVGNQTTGRNLISIQLVEVIRQCAFERRVVVPIGGRMILLIDELIEILTGKHVLTGCDGERELLCNDGNSVAQVDRKRKIFLGDIGDALIQRDLVDRGLRLKIDRVVLNTGIGAVGTGKNDLVETIISRIEDATLIDRRQLDRELLVAEHTGAVCAALCRVGRLFVDRVRCCVVADLDGADNARCSI